MTSASDRAASGDADRVLARLDALASFTDEPGRITRLAFSPALRAANAQVLDWMRAAGLSAHIDTAGNVVGRYAGARPAAPALMIGSHLDTVRDGGRFDGPLGVLCGLAVVERLAREARRLPQAIDLIGFADEEGIRFGGSILGSAVVAGTRPAGWRERTDETGMTAAAALRAFGLDPAAIDGAARAGDPPSAYLELHIEQGPVLETLGVPLGCVTGIAGATRLRVTIEGIAGHAGTVPMPLRRDALAAAAECVLAIERLCAGGDAVGTVGHLRAEPNASNVIAGRVQFSIDIRALEDRVRVSLVEAVLDELRAIGRRRGVAVRWDVTSETVTTPCSPRLVDLVARSISADGSPAPRLVSGAGHDGIAMSAITDIGMIFVRCTGGISHNPAEHVTLDDIRAGLDALYRCCVAIASDTL